MLIGRSSRDRRQLRWRMTCDASDRRGSAQRRSGGDVRVRLRRTARHVAVVGTARHARDRPAAHGAPLTITINDLRNRKGQLIFGVFTSADGFPRTSKQDRSTGKCRDADARRDRPSPPACRPARYAASVLHDENRSGDMDRGLRRHPAGRLRRHQQSQAALRAATFNEATFTLPAAGKALTISLQYF